MTALAPRTETESVAFEVVTTGADQLRARVRVAGELDSSTVPLLLSVLRTHTRVGRRYLDVDLGAATAAGDGVLEPLRQAGRTMSGLGGTLRFENTDWLS